MVEVKLAAGRAGAGSGDPGTYHQRERWASVCRGTEPHSVDHTLLAVLVRGSQLWAAASLGTLDLYVWTWAWSQQPLLPNPASCPLFADPRPPCPFIAAPWGTVTLQGLRMGVFMSK